MQAVARWCCVAMRDTQGTSQRFFIYCCFVRYFCIPGSFYLARILQVVMGKRVRIPCSFLFSSISLPRPPLPSVSPPLCFRLPAHGSLLRPPMLHLLTALLINSGGMALPTSMAWCVFYLYSCIIRTRSAVFFLINIFIRVLVVCVGASHGVLC